MKCFTLAVLASAFVVYGYHFQPLEGESLTELPPNAAHHHRHHHHHHHSRHESQSLEESTTSEEINLSPTVNKKVKVEVIHKARIERVVNKEGHDRRLVDALNKERVSQGLHPLRLFKFDDENDEMHRVLKEKNRFIQHGTELALDSMLQGNYLFGAKHYDKHQFEYGTLIPNEFIPPYGYFHEGNWGKLIFEYMVGKEETPEAQVKEWMSDFVRKYSLTRDYYVAAGAKYTKKGVIFYLIGVRPTVMNTVVYGEYAVALKKRQKEQLPN